MPCHKHSPGIPQTFLSNCRALTDKQSRKCQQCQLSRLKMSIWTGAEGIEWEEEDDEWWIFFSSSSKYLCWAQIKIFVLSQFWQETVLSSVYNQDIELCDRGDIFSARINSLFLTMKIFYIYLWPISTTRRCPDTDGGDNVPGVACRVWLISQPLSLAI